MAAVDDMEMDHSVEQYLTHNQPVELDFKIVLIKINANSILNISKMNIKSYVINKIFKDF